MKDNLVIFLDSLGPHTTTQQISNLIETLTGTLVGVPRHYTCSKKLVCEVKNEINVLSRKNNISKKHSLKVWSLDQGQVCHDLVQQVIVSSLLKR